MFLFALLLGIYSYLIFFLGIFGLLYKDIIVYVTIVFWGGALWKYGRGLFSRFQPFALSKVLKKNKLLFLFVALIVLQAGVNLIGTLGPELGFDALWYHLTLPKLYLANHSVFFIPGGLLYYSAMPKLAEMLYIGGLSFGNEILVKFIHFLFSLLICLALYKLSRKFLNTFFSLVAVVIFYANLVVAWESITAYVDLIRTFFEVMALWAFVNWIELKKKKWLVWSAGMLGLAVTTKLLAMGNLVIFSLLIIYNFLDSRLRGNDKKKIRNLFIGLFIYWIIALAIPLPWFIFSYIHTGNPVYPFFSEIYHVAPAPISLIGFVKEVWNMFMYSADPISPIYMMFLPLIIWLFVKRKMKEVKMIGIYSLLAIIIWYFTPRTGGGRFILPYLPVFSLLCAAALSEILRNKKFYGVFLGKFLLGLVLFISLISIGYRLVANSRYLPVILGTQTKQQFLTSHLNFAYGDFYDTDSFFKENIKSGDRVLLYGFHNLYYVDFPFIDASWRKPQDKFTYVATQNTQLPEEFHDWILVYENKQTMVKLYKPQERMYTLK